MKGCSSWAGIIFMLFLLIGPLLGLSLYLDANGVLAPGTVIDKREYISYGRYQAGSWSRRIDLTVRYQASDRRVPDMTSFHVEPATFDQLALGSPVTVRYPPNKYLRDLLFFPTARLSNESTRTLMQSLVPPWAALTAPFALGAVLLAALWRALRGRGRGPGWILLLYLLGGTTYLTVYHSSPHMTGSTHMTTATVSALRPVRYIYGQSNNRNNVRLAQPYDLVELKFAPVGQAYTVLAVDAVDTGSVPGLLVGSNVPIIYSAADPRTAQLNAGLRTHTTKNALGFFGTALVLMLLSFLSYVMSLSLRGWMRKRMVGLAAARAARQMRGP